VVNILARGGAIELIAPVRDAEVKPGGSLAISWSGLPRIARHAIDTYVVTVVALSREEHLTPARLKKKPAFTETVKDSGASHYAVEVPLGPAYAYLAWVTAQEAGVAIGSSDVIHCICNGCPSYNLYLDSRVITCPSRGSIQLYFWNVFPRADRPNMGAPEVQVFIFTAPSQPVEMSANALAAWQTPLGYDNVWDDQELVEWDGYVLGMPIKPAGWVDRQVLSFTISTDLFGVYGIPSGMPFPVLTLSSNKLAMRDEDFFRFLPNAFSWAPQAAVQDPWGDPSCPKDPLDPVHSWGTVDDTWEKYTDGWFWMRSTDGKMWNVEPEGRPKIITGHLGSDLNRLIDWEVGDRASSDRFTAWASWYPNCPIAGVKLDGDKMKLMLRNLPEGVKAITIGTERNVDRGVARTLGYTMLSLLPGEFAIETDRSVVVDVRLGKPEAPGTLTTARK
jgi:hypothetical protein